MPETRRVRAIRGATTVDSDRPDLVDARVHEMLRAMLERNGVSDDDLISLTFSTTPDITSRNPCTAARGIGFGDVPLLGFQEQVVDGMLGQCVRAMLLVESSLSRADVRHVFLHGATVLRPDLAEVPAPSPSR